MISKNTRKFNIDGKTMIFNFDTFNSIIHRYHKTKKTTINKIEDIISIQANVSLSAVHNWRLKLNGPSDIEIIKAIATALNEKDWKILLTEVKGEKDIMNNFSNRELDAIKRIYDAIIEFLDDFANTTGFNDLWFTYFDEGYKNPENEIYEYAEKKIDYIYLIYKKEYFDLNNREIYDELGIYIDEDLTNTFNSKLSYGYRFEADGISTPTTSQDYEKAMNNLNKIINKYI